MIFKVEKLLEVHRNIPQINQGIDKSHKKFQKSRAHVDSMKLDPIVPTNRESPS